MGNIINDIIPLDSRYVPLVQQKYCCVPACISMIMLRKGIPLLPQELIGYELGLIVPDKVANKFWNPRVGEPYSSGYGTNVGEDKINPNTAFAKLNIPLKMNFKYIDEFDDEEKFLEYLKAVMEKDKDVLACFDWGTFSGNKEKKWGHVCLVDMVDFNKKEIRLIDPGYTEPKWEIVSIEVLYEAMKTHTAENGGGFWEVRKEE